MTDARRVLVIEDDEPARRALCGLLSDAGHVAVGARDGRDAISYLGSGARPSIIVLDLTMSDMNGWQFREWQQKSRLASVPVVIVSASRGLPQIARELGAVAHLPKPVEFDELLGIIDRHASG